MQRPFLPALLFGAAFWVAGQSQAAPWTPPPGIECRWASDGARQLTAHLHNRGAAAASFDLPAGLVAVGASGARLFTLRGTQLEIPAGQTAEAALPAIRLNPRQPAPPEPCTLAAEEVPALQPLLAYSARANDLPRPTAQLVALLLLENPDYGAWRSFLGREPEPPDVATAIDALTIARELTPAKTYALAEDGELRLRALRLPLVRARAMQLFGTAAPEGVPVPDVNQLLHTTPGDNCPICRMRARMEQAGNGL